MSDDDWDPRVQGEPGLGPGPYNVGRFLVALIVAFLAVALLIARLMP